MDSGARPRGLSKSWSNPFNGSGALPPRKGKGSIPSVQESGTRSLHRKENGAAFELQSQPEDSATLTFLRYAASGYRGLPANGRLPPVPVYLCLRLENQPGADLRTARVGSIRETGRSVPRPQSWRRPRNARFDDGQNVVASARAQERTPD